MLQPIHYQVGAPFPLQQYLAHCDGQEKGVPILTPSFLDVVMYVNPQVGDLAKFHNNDVEYGVVEKGKLPLLVVRVTNFMMIDAWLNFRKLPTEAEQQHWVTTDHNGMNLFAVNARTGILEGIRFMGVAPQFMRRLKFYAQQQLASAYTMEALDVLGRQLQAVHTPHQLWAQCFKYRHSEVEDETKGKRKL